MSRRVFDSILIVSILSNGQNTWNGGPNKTYTVLLFVEHEGGNSPAGVSTVASLTVDMNSSIANAKMVDGAGDGTRKGRH